MVSNPARSTESDIVKADPTTILGKFLVGYQGWFTCHGDGEPVGPGHHGWQHWCTYPIADGGNINTDYWPDMSMYEGDELFPAPGFKHLNGEQAYLFSSRHPRTVQKHFRWMAENGVDGAFLQRFVGAVEEKPGDMGGLNIRDEVGKLVEQACEKEGRVYAIMYDAAKCKPKERLQEILEKDWKKLVNDKRILDSPNYLRHEGKPVIAVWGLSWADSDHTPETVRSIAKFLRDNTPGGAYLYAGIPNFWRTAEGDSLPNKDFLPAILESFDAISPWTVGAYPDEPGVDFHAQWRWGPDVDFLKKWEQDTGRHVEYIPTIHPGGTATNMSQGQWPMNGAPRCGGRFLWRQMYHTKRLGARTVYAAMWDEYDEGTQFLPAFVQQHQLPIDQTGRFKFIAYDVDGHVLPSDWYMRIAGYGAEALKGRYPLDEQFPEKVLQDWRHSHPRREQQGEASGSGSGSGEQGSSSYAQWLQTEQTKEGQDLPPPPYSLEQGEGSTAIPSHGPPAPTSTRPQAPEVPKSSRPISSSSLANDMNRLSVSSSSYTQKGSRSQSPPAPPSSSRPYPQTSMSSYPGQKSHSPPPPPAASSRPTMSSYPGQGPPSPRPPMHALHASVSSYPGQGPASPRPLSGPPPSPSHGRPPSLSTYPGSPPSPHSPHPPPSPHPPASPHSPHLAPYPPPGPVQPGFAMPFQGSYPPPMWPQQDWGVGYPPPPPGPSGFSYPGSSYYPSPGPGMMTMPQAMPGYEPSFPTPLGRPPSPPTVPARPASAQPPPPPPVHPGTRPPPSPRPPSAAGRPSAAGHPSADHPDMMKRFESGVSGLAHRGSKLFGKFKGRP